MKIISGKKTPIWMFSGSILLFVFLCFSYVIGTNRHKVEVQKMLNVRKDDVYGHRISNDLFNAYKFDKLTEDTLYYFESKKFIYKKEDLKIFLQKDTSLFSSITNKLTKSEYFKLIDDVELFEIEK